MRERGAMHGQTPALLSLVLYKLVDTSPEAREDAWEMLQELARRTWGGVHSLADLDAALSQVRAI